MCFADLLSERVLRAAGIEARRKGSELWCPSVGEDLQLSVPELLGLIRWYCSHDNFQRQGVLDVPLSPPGWCIERGACAGWKYFGSGWHGHNMYLPSHSLMVRVQLAKRIGIVVAAAGGASATMIMMRMFGRVLPEYRELILPKRLVGMTAGPESARYAGTYSNRAWSIRVQYDERTCLDASLFKSPHPGCEQTPDFRTPLLPGTQGTYLAAPSVASVLQWVQFVPADADRPSHLWNGRQVLRRR